MTHPMQPTDSQILKWFEQTSKAKGMNQMDMPAAHLARLAYAAGADAELEACEECLMAEGVPGYACQLRAGRRPKPTAKELALDACSTALATGRLSPNEASIIRLALEAQS